MFSRSRANTAICARFAASATSVKSRRNGSVDGDVVCLGGGGVILFVDEVRVVANDEACWVVIVGEEIGAFILNCGGFLSNRARRKGWLLTLLHRREV